MKLSEYIDLYKPKINKAILDIFDRRIENIKNSFLKQYYLELKDYFGSGGKRIRPLLTIATYNAFTKEKNDKIIIPSVGIEFLHNASLIHDDIIDKDDYRRGKPSFHYRFRLYHKRYGLSKLNSIDYGNSIGIIGGDNAFFLGLEAYLNNNFSYEQNLRAISLYEEAFIDIANGVLIEMDMVNQKTTSMSDYINMISLKTGALIEKAILMGANYANFNSNKIKELSEFGINLGIVFQVKDDILGSFGDEKITGKPTDGDIREGKKTCLLVEAFEKLEEKKKEKLMRLIERQNMTIKDIQKVKELFLEGKIVDSCKELLNIYYNKAKKNLDELKMTFEPSEVEFFESLLNFISNRNY